VQVLSASCAVQLCGARSFFATIANDITSCSPSNDCAKHKQDVLQGNVNNGVGLKTAQTERDGFPEDQGAPQLRLSGTTVTHDELKMNTEFSAG
jgi:hypothetical protein